MQVKDGRSELLAVADGIIYGIIISAVASCVGFNWFDKSIPRLAILTPITPVFFPPDVVICW